LSRRFAQRTVLNHKTQSEHTPMKSSAKFYHAGCPVCLAAESTITHLIDHSRVDLEIIHLGHAKNRLAEAEKAGVKSVPALVIDGQALHLNFGAALSALK